MGQCCGHTCILIHMAVSVTVKTRQPGWASSLSKQGNVWYDYAWHEEDSTVKHYHCCYVCEKEKALVKKKVSSCIWPQHNSRQYLIKLLSHQHRHFAHLPIGKSNKPINKQTALLCPQAFPQSCGWGLSKKFLVGFRFNQ